LIIVKAFSFKLHTLMQLRKANREKALNAYGKAVHESQQLENDLARKKSALESLQDRIKQKRSDYFFGQEEESYQRNIGSFKNDILSVHKSLKNSQEIREAKRKLFLKAEAEFKSLEKLRERQKVEHDQSEQKKEESQNDHIISARFNYNLKTSIS
jgi:flagellar export protein FliJ